MADHDHQCGEHQCGEHSETVDLELRFPTGEVTSHSRASLHLWNAPDGGVERLVVLAIPVTPHLHHLVARLVISTGERWMAVSRDGRSWSEAPSDARRGSR